MLARLGSLGLRLGLPRVAAALAAAAPPPPPFAAPLRRLRTPTQCCAAPPAPEAAPAPPAPKPKPIPPVRRVTRDDVELTFSRSSGAGGQNVNKVSTKVDMRLRLSAAAAWVAPEVLAAVRVAERNRVNQAGELVITSQRTRSQLANVEDALEKLQEVLQAAWASVQPVEEDPAKQRKLAKQLKRGNEKRLEAKKLSSEKKRGRRAKVDY